MIYNIPYNEDFCEVLAEKAADSLLILPGKYLTDVFKNRGLNAISYDDLWFKILPTRASHIAESIIIDKVIKENYTIRNQLRKAVNEFFYYGLNVNDLICMNAQHDLLQQTIVDLYKLLQENNLSLRASALQDILNSELKLNFDKSVFAVLPVIFSPLFFEILKLFHEKFNFNLVMYGYDKAIDYEISYEHPQYFMREFLRAIQPESVQEIKSLRQLNKNQVCLGKSIMNEITLRDQLHIEPTHLDNLNVALRQLMYPASLLHRLHSERLYKFNHIEKIGAKSIADEFQGILSVIAQSNVKKISIVSKNTEKLKLLYHYLVEKLKIFTGNYRITTSAPSYCYDYPQLHLFFKLLDVVGVYEVSLIDIFAVLRESKYNSKLILLAEKTLLEAEDLDPKNIQYAEKLLEKHKMYEALEIIKQIVSYKDISKSKFDLALPLELSDSKFDKILNFHLSAYLSIIDHTIDERLLHILVEIRQCVGAWNISLKEYKNIILELGIRAVISSDESYKTNDESNCVVLDLLTSVERRFLSYDLTIICDLKEGIWPPAADDHFFISEQTRKRQGYAKPANYEVGYAANDFISIIASSKRVIISELNEAEIFSQDLLKRAAIDSRFLSILYGYGRIAGFTIPSHMLRVEKSDKIKLSNEAVMDIPLHNRPKAFSSTSIEKLMKNPYLYSLEYNLHLKYLRKSFAQREKLPTKKEFGIILHNILNKVSKEINYREGFYQFKGIFQSITQALITERYGSRSEYMMIFWQEKFNNIVEFIYVYNQELYNKHNYDVNTETEKSIAVNVQIAEQEIKLHAYADRLDHTQELLYVSDYKTGQLPSKQDIITGKKPQLNLEGLIITLLDNDIDLMQDNFDDLNVKGIILRYIRLTGIQSTNEVKEIEFDPKTTLKGIAEILRKLYIDVIPYYATEEYDNYLQAHIMRTLVMIEHRI